MPLGYTSVWQVSHSVRTLMSGQIRAALAVPQQAATSPVLFVKSPASSGVCPHPWASVAKGLQAEKRRTKGRADAVETVGECLIKTCHVCAAKQLYLIFISTHTHTGSGRDMFAWKKGHCVTVLHSADYSSRQVPPSEWPLLNNGELKSCREEAAELNCLCSYWLFFDSGLFTETKEGSKANSKNGQKDIIIYTNWVNGRVLNVPETIVSCCSVNPKYNNPPIEQLRTLGRPLLKQ